MKMRKEIENRIAELNAIIAENDKLSEENSKLYYEAEKKLETDLRDRIKDAGFPVDELTRVDNRIYGYTTPKNKRRVNVCFRSKDKYRSEFSVTFIDKKVEDVRATGMSASGTAEDLEHMESYYKMVSQIMERLNSKYFSTNMCLFFETLESFEYPKMKTSEMPNTVREEREELEASLKVLNLELEVGKAVEVYIEGTGKWRRSHWYEATVERMTEKMIYVDCKAYGTKAIKRIEVLDYIRNKPVETCQAREAKN